METPEVLEEASENYPPTHDAKAFNKEMKRRVKLFQKNDTIQDEGDRAIIIGKDVEGKTDGLEEIVREIDTSFSKVNERDISSKLEIFLLGRLSSNRMSLMKILRRKIGRA